MDSPEFNLKNPDIYKESLNCSLKDIYVCLKVLLEQYLKCCLDSNTKVEKYYVDKGINIIVNVFKIILLYTKNLEITKMYAFNSIYFYIEYINQISNKESEIVFVNLTLNDAISYVYRKSIYEISDSYKKKFKLQKEDNIRFKNVNNLILLYQTVFSSYLTSTDNITDLLPSNIIKINSFYEKLFEKKMLTYCDKSRCLEKLYNNYSNIFETIENKKYNIDKILYKMDRSII
uniref:Uncharacterized protein n=1 Tax=viral metagenome TaxID=1070528 RepID=A0A6C0BRG8_9ZZZZ